VTEDSDVEADVLERVRAICLALPDAYEEQAWTGRRWLVRRKTFAHVLAVDDGKPQAHARAVGDAGPVTIVTFRSTGAELEALSHAGHPFFHAGWGRDVVGMVLDDATDWKEVAELLTESYCVLAPQTLAAQAPRPDG
jgi:hypothetical protein